MSSFSSRTISLLDEDLTNDANVLVFLAATVPSKYAQLGFATTCIPDYMTVSNFSYMSLLENDSNR